jgi:hypothetical protein
MTVADILPRLQGVKKSGNGWSARCPAHEDRAASLSVAEGRDGRILLKCFAGCDCGAICNALGIEEKDLFSDPPPRQAQARNGEKRIVASYDYYTRTGDPICRVVRYQPKSFGRMSPAPGGGWKWGGTSQVAALYRWPELAAACAHGEAVWLVEGEKDCDNARLVGLNATTALGGASKWRGEYGAEFVGASLVTIIADNDGPGRTHALKAKASIVSAGVPCRAVCLPAEVNGHKVKDISDALAAGWTREEIERWCRDAEEVENPAPRPTSATDADMSTLRGIIADAVAHAEDDSAQGRREALIPAALNWLRAHGGFFFDKEATDLSGAFYFCRDRRELMQVSSPIFATWLAWESGLNRVSVDFRHLASSCEDAAARAEWSPRIVPALFWCSSDDGKRIYLSCGDGRMARISAKSVEMVDNGTDNVLFSAGRTCKEWKLLDRLQGEPLWDLQIIGDTSTDDPLSPLLLTLWALSLPRNFKNKPPLSLCGEIGSGKTRTATGIYEALGLAPRLCSAKKDDTGADDFWVSVRYGGISTIDNVDSKCKWLPDAIAAASTGGQREKRKLYHDQELVFLSSRSAIIITSANPLYATDAGLADRLINVQFYRKPRQTSDAALTDEIERKYDALMTWVAWTLADALAVGGAPAAVFNKRHPDWADWCWRCGVALGYQAETEAILQKAESNKALISVLSDQVFGNPLYKHLSRFGHAWEGTAKGLSEWLVKEEEYDDRTKAWLSPHRVGSLLRGGRPIYAEVFHLTSRIVNGNTWWRLEPPAEFAKPNAGAFRTRFSTAEKDRGAGSLVDMVDMDSRFGENPEKTPNININNIKENFQRFNENEGSISTMSTTGGLDEDICDEPFNP